MPGSSSVFDDRIKRFIERVPANKFLDLGCGSGKYAWFVKELKPEATIEGYEIDPTYVETYFLERWYDTLNIESCMNVLDRVDDEWDIVTIGDCIEHLRKSDGLDLIHFLMYRCKYMLIVYPDRFLQNAWEGHKHEAHISSWFPDDFEGFTFSHYQIPPMNFIAIQGYIPSPSIKGLL